MHVKLKCSVIATLSPAILILSVIFFTYAQSVKRQYRGGRDFKISHNKFKFKTEAGSEPKIAIGFTRSPPGGWQLALESGSEVHELQDINLLGIY